jgi:HEAT repeat protein
VKRTLFLAGVVCIRIGIAFLYSSWAVDALAQINLRQVISDDPAARQSALRQLAALSEGERLAYLPELTRMVSEGGDRIVPAFAKIGPAAVPYLTQLVEISDASIRIVAVRSLGMMRPVSPAAVELFRRLLSDSSVQRDAAVSLLSSGIEDERARSIANPPLQGPKAVRSREAFPLG